MSTSARRWLAIGGAVVVVAAVTTGLVLFFSGDEPDQVDAERALQQEQEGLPGLGEIQGELETPLPFEEPDGEGPETGTEEPVAPEQPTTPRQPEDLDGRWVVDRSRPFDREEGRGTFAGYRIQEELSGVGNTTAVGRTPEVEGEVVFDGGTIVEAAVTADLTELVSDDRRRDNRVRSQLGPDARARFDLAGSIELPEVPPVGEVIELTVAGTLTLLDTSREVDVTLQAVVTDTGLLVTGSTDIVLSDYDIEVPSATIVLSVSDEATLEWQLFLVQE